ncbi:hypothetical protein EMIT0P176_40234 [Pseudomonas sp. IT-P176]
MGLGLHLKRYFGKHQQASNADPN